MNKWKEPLLRLHGNQSGAIAFLVLASLLIVMMLAWVLYDAQEAARDALDVQAAADTAAWSQSAVESRAMNTIAFANVGKRIVFGMGSYYQAVWLAFIEILAVATIVTIACWIADVFAFGALTAICEKLTEFTIEVGLMMLEELPDLVTLETDLFTSEFLKDIQAFDKYQKYMTDLAPWWGWAEAYSRGARNGATVVGSWPVPQQLPGFDQTSVIDSLPVQRATGDAWMTDLCLRSWVGSLDVLIFLAEYLLKNEINDAGNWKKMLAHALAGPLAAVQFPAGCGIMYLIMGMDDAIQPYQVKRGFTENSWMRATGNMVFSYSPDSKRMSDTGKRRKYGYLRADYNSLPLYTGGGSFAMARSEITYQNGDPDLWHTSWSARMRPIALPGEWSGYGSEVTLLKAWHDVLPYIAIGGALNTVLGGTTEFNFNEVLGSTAGDFLKIEGALGGLSDENIGGLPK